VVSSGSARHAFVRELSPALARCELSFLERATIDVSLAVRQHADYVAQLAALGCEIAWLPPLPDHADGVFVEDTAVVLPEVTVITRPGAQSRRNEVESVASSLARVTRVVRILDPGTLEGGDVMQIGRTLYVGRSARSNQAGVQQLAAAVEPFGYRVRSASMQGCLHLKSAVTFVPPDTVVVNPAWTDAAQYEARHVVEVAEPFGANTLTLAGVTLVSADYPKTQRRLEDAGILTRALRVSELHKAEAALTCMSLIAEGR